MTRKLLFLAIAGLCVPVGVKAQETIVPAGTILQCTMNDPNFSPATAAAGDPVLCQLHGLVEFGQNVLPRGAYLAGHLEAAKGPGHFVGKGYMKIEFDRLGLPDSDVPLDARIIAAQGQHVDRKGDIIGHGHAKRDVAEWMFPPLWPWKVMMLPARGPQPKLKNEQVMTLRLMEDVAVPAINPYSASLRNRSEDAYASARPQSRALPSGYHRFSSPPANYPRLGYLPPAIPAMERVRATPAASASAGRLTLVVMRSEAIYPVTDYWVDGSHLSYVLPDGSEDSVEMDDVDWQRTTDLNAQRGVRIILHSRPSD